MLSSTFTASPKLSLLPACLPRGSSRAAKFLTRGSTIFHNHAIKIYFLPVKMDDWTEVDLFVDDTHTVNTDQVLSSIRAKRKRKSHMSSLDKQRHNCRSCSMVWLSTRTGHLFHSWRRLGFQATKLFKTSRRHSAWIKPYNITFTEDWRRWLVFASRHNVQRTDITCSWTVQHTEKTIKKIYIHSLYARALALGPIEIRQIFPSGDPPHRPQPVVPHGVRMRWQKTMIYLHGNSSSPKTIGRIKTCKFH